MKMAALKLLLLLLTAAVAVAAARPCKSNLYFSPTTTSTAATYYPHHFLPTKPYIRLQKRNPSYLTLISTTTRLQEHNPSPNFDSIKPFDRNSQIEQSDFYTPVSSSIRRRTGDSLNAAGELLFGLGCGALAGATLYFVWALLFSTRRFDFDFDEGDYDYDYYDDVSAAEKLGYVPIPCEP